MQIFVYFLHAFDFSTKSDIIIEIACIWKQNKQGKYRQLITTILIQFIMGNQQGGQTKNNQDQRGYSDFEEQEFSELQSVISVSESLQNRFEECWQPREPQVTAKKKKSHLKDIYKKGVPVADPQSSIKGTNVRLSAEHIRPRKIVSESAKTVLPYSAIGFLDFYFDDPTNKSMGTAFIIGERMALTCGHNIYDVTTKVKKARGVVLIMGQGDAYSVKDMIVPTQFIQPTDSQHDYAILILDTDPSKKYGYLGLDFDSQIEKEINIIGVPHQIKKDVVNQDRDLYQAKGKVSMDDTGPFLIYNIQTSKGQSGSPVVLQKKGKFYAVGIHLGEDFKNPQIKHARYLDQTLQLQYKSRIVHDTLLMNFSKVTPHEIEILQRKNFDNLLKLQLRVSLQELIAKNHSKFDSFVEKRLSTMNKLTWLDLGQNKIRSLDANKLPPSLVCLQLDDNHLKDEFVTAMNQKHWPNLQTLFISKNNIQKANFNLMRFPALTTLDLSSNLLKSQCLQILGEQNPPKLSDLTLSDNPMFSSPCPNLKNCNFPQLTSLALSKTNINTKSIQQLNKINMPLLKILELANNKIGKDLIQELGKTKILEQIITLNLSDNQFSEMMPVLVKLNLPKIKSLDLDIDDSDLPKIKDTDLKKLCEAKFFPNLGSLSMQSSNITAQTLKTALQKGTSLECVSVEYNENIQNFNEQDYPNIKIYFDELDYEDSESTRSKIN